MRTVHRRSHELREWVHLRPWRRHSVVLAVAGISYFTIGYSFAVVPLTPDRRGALGLALAYGVGMGFWGAVFMAVGFIALLSARWPPRSETWGYTVLAGLSALWSLLYLFTWMFSTAGLAGTYQLANVREIHVPAVFPDVPESAPNTVILWALFGFLWWAISGLVNPKDLPLAEE